MVSGFLAMYLQSQPKDFIESSYSFDFEIDAPAKDVWKWLNNPRTFTDTQIWPYKVEFYSPDPENIPDGFHQGVFNIHYGPMINFAGKITEIGANYRDLQYFYGSYALSIRWVRPYRLEFWTTEKEGKTTIKCKVSYWVKPWIEGAWMNLQKLFWVTFPRFARKSITK